MRRVALTSVWPFFAKRAGNWRAPHLPRASSCPPRHPPQAWENNGGQLKQAVEATENLLKKCGRAFGSLPQQGRDAEADRNAC